MFVYTRLEIKIMNMENERNAIGSNIKIKTCRSSLVFDV